MSGEDSTSLASKCMAFCQTLASQGQVFNFSLSIGPDFSFSLDTRSKAVKTRRPKRDQAPLRFGEMPGEERSSMPRSSRALHPGSPVVKIVSCCHLLKRREVLRHQVNSSCLQIMCRGRRWSFLSKKVLLPLFFVLHHLLHLPWDMDVIGVCAQWPSLLKMTSEYMFMNTIQCAIVRCTQHPVPGNDVDPGCPSNRYLW